MAGQALSIDYTVQIWREGAAFVAHAMPLDVMSAGSNPVAARSALDEAVGLYLKTAAEHGTLEALLEDAGYALRDGEWESPAWVSVERHTLSVAT